MIQRGRGLRLQAMLIVGNNSRALTLIELIVTVTIISILAGVTIASMKTVNRPQQLVENVTNTMQNALNQANVNSLTTASASNLQVQVCSLRYNAGSGFAECDNRPSWDNINGNKLPSGVSVSVTGAASNQITYASGLLPPASISPPATNITITISFANKVSCFNTITIWPNGVLDMANHATIDNC